jgi:integrase
MARVYKKPLYRQLPDDANIIQGNDGKQYACWINDGKEMKAEFVQSKNGARVVTESEFYIARYTDANGRFRERSTGCRDQRMAEHKLNTWLQEIEKVKSGILSQEEFEVSKRISDSIDEQLAHFEEHLKAKGATSRYIRETISRIMRVCIDCNFKLMAEINATILLRWLNQKGSGGMGMKTRNGYREVMMTFCNWAVKDNSIAVNPLSRVPKLRESADKRHERHALSSEEIVKLLNAAESRPIHDVTAIRVGKRKKVTKANVREEIQAEAKQLGLERKLLYATLIYTGLRKSELASITIGQIFLDHEIPHLVLAAKDEKSRRGSTLPLHPELVQQLRKWLKLKGKTSPKDKLFTIPDALCKILDRDLKYAGIDKRDSLNRVIDVHALRHTHAILLARRGVSPTVAQSAMRHSDIRMTMGVYTHLELENIAEGVNRIPDFLNKKNEENIDEKD